MNYQEQFDHERQIKIREYFKESDGLLAIAKQLHKDAVNNNEVLDSEWGNSFYQSSLVIEAREIYRERGEGPEPKSEDGFLVKIKGK